MMDFCAITAYYLGDYHHGTAQGGIILTFQSGASLSKAGVSRLCQWLLVELRCRMGQFWHLCQA
jgi:hypothetical protein